MAFTPREPEPYLYILMRSDLDSLNPGKMVAQGAHAANQFAFYMNDWRVKFLQTNPEFLIMEADAGPKEGEKWNALFLRKVSGFLHGIGAFMTFDDGGYIDPSLAVKNGFVKTESFGKEILGQLRLFDQWESSTRQGFGVTICLDVNERSLPAVVDAARSMGMPAGVTHDPSYPLKDGAVYHSIPLDTCGFVFGDKPKLTALLGQFDLLA